MKFRSWFAGSAALASALALGGAGAQSLGESAAAAVPLAPVALTGTVPSGVGSDDVSVTLSPDAEVLRALADGQSAATMRVADTAVAVANGRYTVRLDPRSVPPAFIDRFGVVSFDVLAVHGSSTWTTTTSVRAVQTSAGARWADAEDSSAAQGAVPAGRTSGLPRYRGPAQGGRTASMTPITHPAGVAARAEAAAVAGNCVGLSPRKTRVGKKISWATIGTTYPVGRSTAWMSVNSSEGATYGVAASGSGAYGSWHASGSRKVSGGWGFEWNPAKGARSYQKEIEYRQYKYEYLDPRCNRRTWEPIVETGGTSSNRDVERPNFTKCREVGLGKWYRDKSEENAYEYGGAVKMTQYLGIDLSISRQYSKKQKLIYNVVGKKYLCGDNAHPSEAGKVMERFRG